MVNELAAVKKQKLADVIVEQLLKLLREGELRVGEKLPAERELAARFGVSRVSLRDAIRYLEFLGYLEVRQGGGTFVRAPDSHILMQPFQSLLAGKPHLADDLIQFRLLLEPEIAGLAATHCTPADANALRQSLTEQEKLVRAGERISAEDVHFHRLIARSAKNVTVLYVLDTLQALLKDLRARLLTGDKPKLSLRQHSDIADAIIRHDAAAAKTHMIAHLEAVMTSVRREEESPQIT